MMRLAGKVRSPWTERARWPLDHHGLAYEFIPYRRWVDDVWLRVFSRQLRDPIVTPVLKDKSQVIRGAFQVALHAERAGAGPRLIPDISAIVRWNNLSDRALTAGRLLAVQRMVDSDAALLEVAADQVPAALGRRLLPLLRQQLRRDAGLHGLEPGLADLSIAGLRAICRELREGLAAGSGFLIGGRYSYADIAMAVALHGLIPVRDEHFPLPDALRECHTHEALAKEFGDLIVWRDALYEKRRAYSFAPPRAASVAGNSEFTPNG